MIGQQRWYVERNAQYSPGSGLPFWSRRTVWDLRCEHRCTPGYSAFQFFDAAEDTTANALVGDLRKPAFDQIQPGTVSGREMDMETRSFGEPISDHGCLVRS